MSKRFKDACQRKLNKIPDFPCQNAINAIQGRGKKSLRCPWYINNKISCYCWFKYYELIMQEYGKIYEHTFEEIAQMDNCTATYIKIIESKALKKICKKMSKKNPEILDIIKDL